LLRGKGLELRSALQLRSVAEAKELPFSFFFGRGRGFYLRSVAPSSPKPSLLLRKQCLSLRELFQSHREREQHLALQFVGNDVVVGIDAKDGYVAVQGWGEISNIKAVDLARKFADVGVEAVICTDINKDGMLGGVNIEFSLQIARNSKLETIASGGVSDINDILMLKATNEISGVIVGKAYYEGLLDLKEAFKLLR